MFLLCSSTLRRTTPICALDLKNLNEHVQYHFKMDMLQSERNCYRALVDLKDPYYSVTIDDKY